MINKKLFDSKNQRKENPMRSSVYFSSVDDHVLRYNRHIVSVSASWGFGGAGPLQTAKEILESAIPGITEESKGVASMFLQKVIMASDQGSDLWIDEEDVKRWVSNYKLNTSPEISIPSNLTGDDKKEALPSSPQRP